MRCADHHLRVDETGVGKCSVPMWCMGVPDGFCDEPAYGPQLPGARYDGYVPGLACKKHGGPAPRHFGDPCIRCGTPHDEVQPGPCPSTLPSA